MKNKKHQNREWECKTPLSAVWTPPYRKYAAGIIVIELIVAAAAVISPLAQRLLIDGVNKLNRVQTIRGVVAVAILFGIAWLGQQGSYLLRFRLSMEARTRLKSSLFLCLLGLPEHFLKDRGSGYFFNRIQVDSREIVQFYSGNAMLQFSYLLKFVLAFSVIACLHGKCALLIIPFLLMQFLVYRKYREKQYLLGKKTQECTASEQYRMQEYLSGHATLKSHNAVRQAQEKMEQSFSRWRSLTFLRLIHENRFHFVLQIPLYFCCGGVAIYGLDQVLLQHWTLGELWALLMLFRQVFAPMQSLASVHFQTQPVQAAWDRMKQIVHTAPEQEGESCPGDCSLKGDIVFSHIRFSYAADRMLFQDLNFTVRNHELLFLTGPNGTGKTTVFQLLLRLYDPLSGGITIGGTPIRKFSLAPYRSRIGYLGQTPEFFPGTIRENISLDAKYSDNEIRDVLRLLKSEEFIMNRPDGLEARVMERGENFSGGERLRIALARELLRSTDILLLDEPAAGLDPEARKDFYDLLLNLRGRCTIIAIIHDLLPPSEFYSFLNLRGDM